MTTSFFSNIRAQVINELSAARADIKVAVCWFTSKELFDVLNNKLKNKIPVTLIVLNDSINNRPDGLKFQSFVDLGGTFYFADIENPMHNKYCIIDNKTLINGSYNWTYFAENKNYENITVIKNEDNVIKDFVKNFNELKEQSKLVTAVEKDAKTDNQQMTIVENTRLASDTDLIIQSKKNIDKKQLKLIFTIGIITNIDVYTPIILKDSNIPISKTSTMTTGGNNQIELLNKIFFGESPEVSRNTHIGSFAVTDIPPLPKHIPKFLTTFSIDEFGILTISFKVEQTGLVTIQKYNIDYLLG